MRTVIQQTTTTRTKLGEFKAGRWRNTVGRPHRPLARSPTLGSTTVPSPNQQNAYVYGSTIRQALLEEEEYLLRSREGPYPPDGLYIDEYEGPDDLGFWRMEIEDQAEFICNELDLTDDQALYLLNALGLLPEGASTSNFRLGQEEEEQQQQAYELHEHGSLEAHAFRGVLPPSQDTLGDMGKADDKEYDMASSGCVAAAAAAAYDDEDGEADAEQQDASNSFLLAENSWQQRQQQQLLRTAGDSYDDFEEVTSDDDRTGSDDDGDIAEEQGRGLKEGGGGRHLYGHPYESHQQAHGHQHGGMYGGSGYGSDLEGYGGGAEETVDSTSLYGSGFSSLTPAPHTAAATSDGSPAFQVSIRPNIALEAKPSGLKVAPGVPALPYDQISFDRDYEVIQLRVIGRRASTAAASGDEIDLTPGRLIAGRYQVLEQVGMAGFSRAVQAYDTLERRLVCLKVVKNSKECMDACLEEVRLLQLVNARDPHDQHHIARMYDYFYHMGHLFLVVELLGGNLFDTQCYDPTYFTAGRLQSIAQQVLRALAFLHSHHIIHADVKPENILVKNYTKCAVKLIDLGCSIYTSEAPRSHYVQSRSYRAPEVMLGLPYDGKIDVWSLGCVMAELVSGQVLFPHMSEASMIARLVGMLGPLPPHMLREGTYAGAFFTRSGCVYERSGDSGLFELLEPKRTSLQARLTASAAAAADRGLSSAATAAAADRGLLHFIRHLLVSDPARRPSAHQALKHPWLQYRYRSPK
ncbi:hypothetical protein Agub_g6040 [Astrephomene gubernaculifera]|uniref:Protein kinase domain-containing protein n=1 Tax=Astrephomene gubernaculifera TaxID=47775 RepID=A0AAD3DPP0_9CHLO|nr:hypothetical protein Agub_g6040 [Astrephomene gubernaculifera]